MNTACGIVFTALFCLSVLFMMPCPALASPSLIQYLTITDSSGRMLPGYSFDTNCDTYYLYFDHPQTLNFWARAYPDAYMIDSDHSKVKEISFQQQISKEHTVVYISAGLVEIRGHKSYLLKNITRPLLTIGTPYQGLRLEHL